MEKSVFVTDCIAFSEITKFINRENFEFKLKSLYWVYVGD